MKIVFLAHRYWPIVGGVEIYLQRLCAALRSHGHTIDIITSHSRNDLAETESHDGVTIHRFPARRSPMRCRLWFLRHLPLLRCADIIHVSNTHMLELLWRMVGPAINRQKVFLTRHGMSYQFPVPDSEKRRAVRSRLLCNGVIHDGEFIEKWLDVPADLCPDQGLFPPADAISQSPEPPPTSATFIGRLEPDSGIETYLDAVAILTKEKQQRFELWAYGDGSLSDQLRDRVGRESLPVHLMGRTANAQDEIASSCFAFIDGRMAIQEAMARQRLVFAAYGDPLKKDYVGTEPFSPYLVPVRNGNELVDRLEFYIENTEARRRLVTQAFEHAQTLTWERTACAYQGFWEDRRHQPSRNCTLATFVRLIAGLHTEPGRPKSKWANQPRFAGSSAQISLETSGLA